MGLRRIGPLDRDGRSRRAPGERRPPPRDRGDPRREARCAGAVLAGPPGRSSRRRRSPTAAGSVSSDPRAPGQAAWPVSDRRRTTPSSPSEGCPAAASAADRVDFPRPVTPQITTARSPTRFAAAWREQTAELPEEERDRVRGQPVLPALGAETRARCPRPGGRSSSRRDRSRRCPHRSARPGPGRRAGPPRTAGSGRPRRPGERARPGLERPTADRLVTVIRPSSPVSRWPASAARRSRSRIRRGCSWDARRSADAKANLPRDAGAGHREPHASPAARDSSPSRWRTAS